jgi:hypothetical protein
MKTWSVVVALLSLTTACSTSELTPSASLTTTQPVWPQYFTLEWSVEPTAAGSARIAGYLSSNSKAFPASNIQILAQALDDSGAVIGERIEWVPGVLPPSGRIYFTVAGLPPAKTYQVNVWNWEFLQEPGGGPAIP